MSWSSTRNFQFFTVRLSAQMGNLTYGVQKLMTQLWWQARRRKERTWTCQVGRADKGYWQTLLWGNAYFRPSPRQDEDSLHPGVVTHTCSSILEPQVVVHFGLNRSQDVCIFAAGSSDSSGSRRHHPVGYWSSCRFQQDVMCWGVEFPVMGCYCDAVNLPSFLPILNKERTRRHLSRTSFCYVYYWYSCV